MNAFFHDAFRQGKLCIVFTWFWRVKFVVSVLSACSSFLIARFVNNTGTSIAGFGKGAIEICFAEAYDIGKKNPQKFCRIETRYRFQTSF